MSRSRLLLTAFVAVALAGLAAGLLVARESSAAAVPSGLIARGEFDSLSWSTRGTASIVGRNGHAVLELRGFQTQKAPELWIVLEGKAGVISRQQLTHLKRAGAIRITRSPPAWRHNPPARVLIYCTKCGKVWGYAPLRTAHTSLS